MAADGAEVEVGGAKVERVREREKGGRARDEAEAGARVAARAKHGQGLARSRERWQQGGKSTGGNKALTVHIIM